MLNVYRPVPSDLLAATHPVSHRRALRFLLNWYDAIAGSVTAIIAILLVAPLLSTAPWMALWPALFVLYQLSLITLARWGEARAAILRGVRATAGWFRWMIFGPAEPSSDPLGSGIHQRDRSGELSLLHGVLALGLTAAAFLFVITLDRAAASAGMPAPLMGAGWLLFVLPVLRVARYASFTWVVSLGGLVILCDAFAWTLAAGRLDLQGAWIIALHACWLTLISLLPAIALRYLAERRADLSAALKVVSAISRLTTTSNPSESAFANQAAAIIAQRLSYDEVNILITTSDDERIARGLRFLGAASEAGRELVEAGFVVDKTQGITGWCANNGMLRLVNDVTRDPAQLYLPHDSFKRTRSELAFPLSLDGVTLGVLDVQCERPYAFSEDDVEILSLIAQHVTLSLDSVRRLTRAHGLAHVTQGIARRLLAQQELRPALEEIVGIARETLGADTVALYPRQPEDGRIGEPVTAGRFETEPASAARVALRGAESAVARALHADRALFELYDSPPEGVGSFIAREQVRAVAILPLRVGVRAPEEQASDAATIGVIFVNYRAPRLFPPEYREWCAALADLAALALQSAMLYQRVAEEERANTWHDIHDGLAQSASVSRWLIEQITSEWERAGALSARGGEKLLTARDAIRAMQRQVNYLIEVWRERDTADIWQREDGRLPTERAGFFAELREYASLVYRTLEVECAPQCAGDDSAFSFSLRHDALMIVREAVNNADRHGRAKKIEISALVEDGSLRLAVSDNGCGFDTSRLSKSHGINGIRERASRRGGAFALHSSREPGSNGTTLVVTLPVGGANTPTAEQGGADELARTRRATNPNLAAVAALDGR